MALPTRSAGDDEYHLLEGKTKGAPPVSELSMLFKYLEGQCDLPISRVEEAIKMKLFLVGEGVWARSKLLLVQQRVSLDLYIH